MRVAIVSKFRNKKIERILRDYGFKVVRKNPHFILCYGGDGTVLFAEREFPSIPKLIIKTSRKFRRYDYDLKHLRKILYKIKSGDYKINEEIKLKALYKKRKLVALNEIQAHNKLATRALRFSVSVGNKQFKNLVGDGIIISTPFGSTGYYLASGGIPFKKGIGICFNNPHPPMKKKSFVVTDKTKVRITTKEKNGLLIRDNDENFIELKKDETVLVQKSEDVAKFIEVNT